MRRRLIPFLAVPMIMLLAAWGPLRDRLPTWLAGFALPGLSIEGLSPGLREISAARVTYSDAQGVWLVIEQPQIRLDPLALIRRRAEISRLAAAEIRVERWPEGDTAPRTDDPGPLVPELPVALNIEGIELPRVILPMARLSITGRARLADGQVDAELAARELEGEARLDLRARFDGARIEGRFDLADPRGSLAGAPTAARLDLDGPAEGAAYVLEGSWGEVTGSLRGTVRREADATELTAEGGADIRSLVPEDLRPLVEGARLRTALRATDAGEVTLGETAVEAPAGLATLSGRAAPELDLAFALRAAESARFAALLPEGISFAGALAEGRIAGPRARPVVEARLAPEELRTGVEVADTVLGPAPAIRLRAAPDLAGSRVELDGAAIAAAIEGDLGEVLDARGTARLTAIPGGVEGEAVLRLVAQGPRADPSLAIELDSERLAVAGFTAEALSVRANVENPLTAPAGTAQGGGTVGGLPLELDVALRPENGAARVERGRLRYGPAVADLAGLFDSAQPRAEGRLRLEVPDLRPFSALAGQELAGRITAVAEGDSAAQWRLRVEAPNVAAGGQSGRATLTVAGVRDRAEIAFDARTALATIALAGTARLDVPLEAEVRRFTLQAQGESLRLTAPLRLRWDGTDTVLENIRATTGQGGTLTGGLAVRGAAQALSGRLQFTGLPLGLVRVALPDTPLRGALAGEIRLGGTVAVPEADVALRGTGLGLDQPGFRALPPGTLDATARLRGTAVEGRATLAAGNALRLQSTFALPDPERLSLVVTGEADAGVLSAPFLAGGGDRVTGRLGINARAEGPVSAPNLSGSVELRGLNYANPDTGVRLQNIRGRAALEGDRVVLRGVEGQTGGGGTVSLSGSVAPFEATLPVDLRLQARRAGFASPDYGRVIFDADLALSGALRAGGRLGGTVRVTSGELRVPDRLPRSVTVLVPFRETGRTPPGRRVASPPPRRNGNAARAPETPPLDIALAVRVEAPGGLFLRGRGLDTELVGRLEALGTVAAPEIRGELRAQRGTFALAGRQLRLSRAILRFDQGSLIPTLDIRATARTANYTIEVGFTGPATEPRVVLESQPPLPQDEILARLLFDRATNRLSPFEIIGISEALAQLTGVELPGGGTDGVLARIRQFLGLDQLGVGGEGGAQAGRYLAPGVYMGLRQGADGQTGVGIEAEITPRLRLEGSAGTAGERVGATYQFEW